MSAAICPYNRDARKEYPPATIIQRDREYRVFRLERIRDVGTFQDAGPFVDDALVLELSEMTALFPFFLISLGTSAWRYADISEKESDNTRQKSVLRRLGEAF